MAGSGDSSVDKEAIKQGVIEALRSVYDPEIPISIYDMGLIYGIEVDDDGRVRVEMTLTAPGCPIAFSMPLDVEDEVRRVPGVIDVEVAVVWDPPWTPDRMTEEARLELGFF